MSEKASRRRRSYSEAPPNRRRRGEERAKEENDFLKKDNIFNYSEKEPYQYMMEKRSEFKGNENKSKLKYNSRQNENLDIYANSSFHRRNRSESHARRRAKQEDSIALNVKPLSQCYSPPAKIPKNYFNQDENDEEKQHRSYHHHRPRKLEFGDEMEEKTKPNYKNKNVFNPNLFEKDDLNDKVPKADIFEKPTYSQHSRVSRRKNRQRQENIRNDSDMKQQEKNQKNKENDQNGKDSKTKEEKQNSYYQKPFKEILTEKPVFSSRATPKPLIGTENDMNYKPMVIKPLSPMEREAMQFSEFDNRVDDYRARRLGYSPNYEAHYATQTHAYEREKKKDRIEKEKDNYIENLFSSKRRSQSASAAHSRRKSAKEQQLEKMWVPKAMADNQNMSIDGVVRQPLLDNSKNKNSITNTSSDSEELNCMDEIPVDVSQFSTPKTPTPSLGSKFDSLNGTDSYRGLRPKTLERKEINQRYKPPELKQFESSPVSKFAELPISSDIPKATVKRPSAIKNDENESISPKTNSQRTRRRKP